MMGFSVPVTDEDRVTMWKIEQILVCCPDISDDDALLLATVSDLQDVRDLRAKGCPVHLLAAIPA